jgi:hypothetical protein
VTLNRRQKPGKPVDRCGPTGKRRYGSEEAALDALESTQAKAAAGETRRHELRAYKCARRGGGWHLTKAPKEAIAGMSGPLPRHGWIARSATPLPQRNERQHAAKAKRGRRKHDAFLRSGVPELVRERSGGRCEFAVPVNPHVVDRGHRFEWVTAPEKWIRCEVTADTLGRALDLCHLGYHGYGGEEDPEKVLDGCPGCHTLWGTLYQPQHRRGGRAS